MLFSLMRSTISRTNTESKRAFYVDRIDRIELSIVFRYSTTGQTRHNCRSHQCKIAVSFLFKNFKTFLKLSMELKSLLCECLQRKKSIIEKLANSTQGMIVVNFKFLCLRTSVNVIKSSMLSYCTMSKLSLTCCLKTQVMKVEKKHDFIFK